MTLIKSFSASLQDCESCGTWSTYYEESRGGISQTKRQYSDYADSTSKYGGGDEEDELRL